MRASIHYKYDANIQSWAHQEKTAVGASLAGCN